ncbi:MAG: sigma 54-interacting transcriptional regulator [Acidobacteriaceae bacterium]|nr:sigma 54-interacting transcriptional regulator [Acidobacteriaceae bacterium]
MIVTMPEKILSFPSPVPEAERIVGANGGLRQVWDAVRLVAPTDAAVLIQGETGTGKELIARAIHDWSQRQHSPYVKVNCAAIPAGLLESELFGHERGAFTGALTQTTGRFQLANGGTLFLDEVGDLPLELQPKLLRVLQEHEFERLGSTRTIRVNVRVVAATNLNLIEMVRERRFRADLYFRLNVFPISIPPLRERSEDIPDLVWHFVRKFAARMNKNIEVIPNDVMNVLQLHDWPGNIRELQNLIERAVIMSESPVLCPPFCVKSPEPVGLRTLAETERDHIVEVLRSSRGRISGDNGAAARLGMKRTTLQYRMRKLGIEQKRVFAAAASA